jgi:hypothetical protein
MSENELQAVAKAAVRETFLALGVDISDPEAVIDMQADFQHLRAWRESTEAVKRKALLTAVGVVITGALGWLGLLLFNK